MEHPVEKEMEAERRRKEAEGQRWRERVEERKK